jgi:hypothetical protein
VESLSVTLKYLVKSTILPTSLNLYITTKLDFLLVQTGGLKNHVLYITVSYFLRRKKMTIIQIQLGKMVYSVPCAALIIPKRKPELMKFKGQTTKAMIITGKRKKRYFDKQGKEINDKDTLDLIQQGANVISYHEQMPAGAKDTQYDKRNRRLIRGK